jgi:hypothetical protein
MAMKLKTNIILLYSILTVLLCGCSRNDKHSNNIISVDVETQANVDDYFQDSHFVVLETNDSALIAGDTKFHTNSKYIVGYSDICGFTVFDQNGKHICTFNHRGEGPGEYTRIVDFYLQDDIIYATADFQQKIYEYAATNGNLVDEIKLPNTYSYVAPLDSKHIALCTAFNSAATNSFAILNIETGDIEKEFVPNKHNEAYTFSGYQTFIGRDGENGVYAALPFSHDLYRLTSETCDLMRSYEFNTPAQLPQKDAEDISLEQMAEKYRYERVVKWLGYIQVMKSGVCYQHFPLLCDYGILPFICKYNTEDNQIQTLKIGSERFEKFPYLLVAPFEFRDGQYICAVQAASALSTDQQIGVTTFTDLGVTPDDNPIIFYYNFKD